MEDFFLFFEENYQKYWIEGSNKSTIEALSTSGGAEPNKKQTDENLLKAANRWAGLWILTTSSNGIQWYEYDCRDI